MPIDVLIAGGGPAALEAVLRLRRLAEDRVSLTLLSPTTAFTYRPLSVLEPFSTGSAWSYPLARIAADHDVTLRTTSLLRVDPDAHEVELSTGAIVRYDALLVATGAVARAPFAGVTLFSGSAADAERVHGLVQDVEAGYVRSVAFVVPGGGSWPLPTYELALMLAERAFQMGVDVDLHLITPEPAPLAVFGEQAADEVRRLLGLAGVALHTGVTVEGVDRGRVQLNGDWDTLTVERVVSLPVLSGPRIPGLPADEDGFLACDPHGRVAGVVDVYAAGDVTDFPVKQGGLACAQADAVAEHLAARAGVALEPQPFHPVIHGLLLTDRWARFLRRDTVSDEDAVAGRALWWPPTKIAGRELAGYLAQLDGELGHARDGLRVESRRLLDASDDGSVRV